MLKILLSLLAAVPALAQTPGEIRYQSNDLQFYSGISWSSMDAGDTGVACTTATPGEIRFNTTPSPDRMEFCNASSWRRMDYSVTASACANSGEIDWASASGLIRYCNGTNWVETALGISEITVYLTSGTSWSVPAGWNNANNTIEVIGGGGGGAGNGKTNQAAGGGGGAYAKISNLTLTPGASVAYVVGAGGAGAAANSDAAGSGTSTYFNGASFGAASVGAVGGASGATAGTAGLAASSIGTLKYSGGAGGSPSNASWGGTGGGGAGGPNGAGARGGNETIGSSSETGATGGGGGGGGAQGGDISSVTSNGSAGGNNASSAGGGGGGTGGGSPTAGTAGSAGAGGGGGGGSTSFGAIAGGGGVGGNGSEWDATHGSGGGGGGGGGVNQSWQGAAAGGNGGLYGAGGGGGGTTSADSWKGGNGAQGIVKISYTPPVTPTVVQDAATVWNVSTSPKSTTSFDVQAGDVLVAYLVAENDQGSYAIAGGSLTWNLHQHVNVAGYAEVMIWSATVDSNKTMAVTVTNSGNTNQYGVNVITFRNSSGVGSSASTHVASGTPSVDLTTTQARSAVVTAIGDWDAADGASRAWLGNAGAFTERSYNLSVSAYTLYGGYHPNVNAAGTYSIGLSAPTGLKYSIAAVEVRGK